MTEEDSIMIFSKQSIVLNSETRMKRDSTFEDLYDIYIAADSRVVKTLTGNDNVYINVLTLVHYTL